MFKFRNQAYDQIFGDALREYNAKQKRKDRKIDNYLDHIKQSKNNEKVFYENVVQIGKGDDTGILAQDGNITDEALLAREILDEYVRTFRERNPNLILFNAVRREQPCKVMPDVKKRQSPVR